MRPLSLVILTLSTLVCIQVQAQSSFSPSQVLNIVYEDIYTQLAEQGMTGLEDVMEELQEIAANPINLNQTTEQELQRLAFLSNEQIDAILRYAYRLSFHSTAELKLIPELHEYDVRNLLPFVKVEEVRKDNTLYFREVMHYAKHELTARVDMRNAEDFDNDPMYAKLRYRFNYQNRVQAGITLCRPTGSEWQKIQYGGFIQLNQLGAFKTIVLGNYQASFGLGLVVGTPFHMGKSSYVLSTTTQREGLRKFASVGDDYDAFHGLGVTTSVKWADISAFYSLQQQDSGWHHVIGANLTGKWKQLKVGATMLQNLYSNVNEEAQVVLGLNARYNIGKMDVWGEAAATQGQRWGFGGIIGARFAPVTNIGLVALYRYYSTDFHNTYAYAFSEHSTLNDESGFYLGTEITRLPHWRIAAYGDGFREGYDILIQTDYIPDKPYAMSGRLRCRRQEYKDTYALRYGFTYTLPQWTFRTRIDGNMVGVQEQALAARTWTYGVSLFQDIEYRIPSVPVVLQLRLQGFDARQWNNRIYAYENDVLYAYSIPSVYGLGLRTWLNIRYKINDHFSLYLRASETLYQTQWAKEHDKKSTRTDVHMLLVVKL